MNRRRRLARVADWMKEKSPGSDRCPNCAGPPTWHESTVVAGDPEPATPPAKPCLSPRTCRGPNGPRVIHVIATMPREDVPRETVPAGIAELVEQGASA
jgi:hypothetical protein